MPYHVATTLKRWFEGEKLTLTDMDVLHDWFPDLDIVYPEN